MINSSSLTDKHSVRFRSLALLTVVTIYLLVLAGGIVRGTGSGMGCPDWPKCFGRWVPPTEVSQLPPNYQQVYGAKLKGEVEFNAVKTWIEYINRLLGAFSGFLVLATLVASLPYLRKDRLVFWGTFLALLLILANAWLGSRVVATELAQYMITFHLLLAILLVFSLLFVLVRSGAVKQPALHSDQNGKKLNSFLLLLLAVSFAQIVLGTQVRDGLNEVVKRIGYDQREQWISELDWRFYVHRSFSLVVLALHIGFIYQLKKSFNDGVMRQLTTGLITLVVAEIVTGIVMAYFAVPAAAQPAHLFLAVLMMGLQFTIWLLLHPALSSPKRIVDTTRLQKI
ncbi:COX15/CtaA family protein [Spirosoma utsteinense]|uniref:Cytochrome c oxidase assembly protein subunit 15 n=1 Tax=Spirosoma utsteinense TaxID=2585773 RepID=A0ABR6W4I4_9BACT|nr:COX15/CtaA family protein [Spirosoma utsteinense]MBC3785465.1 cytochrome c oxidase assembly protein subunit 15 [Spirosoma utsteinense]MBC3791506.1 cytochrome c oxidase assembly protein subunit 15 [Spirosoma utsteinense]